MKDTIKVLFSEGFGEITEKKSRFLAQAVPVTTEEEAVLFVESARKKYWDASHHCYAYIIGEQLEKMKCSDDGEPSQTAGKPILDVLLGAGVGNACIVVTRYFGGTLLGTGGLVRAYGGAARECLQNAVILEKQRGYLTELSTEYTHVGRIQYLSTDLGFDILETEYGEKVVFHLLVSLEIWHKVRDQLTESTSGAAAFLEIRQVSFGKAAGKIYFDEKTDKECLQSEYRDDIIKN